MGVQRLLQMVETMLPIKIKGRHLPTGVGTGIGATGQGDRLPIPSDLAQGFFEFTLHSTGGRLPLAAQKVGAVVSKDNLVTSHSRWSGNRCAGIWSGWLITDP